MISLKPNFTENSPKLILLQASLNQMDLWSKIISILLRIRKILCLPWSLLKFLAKKIFWILRIFWRVLCFYPIRMILSGLFTMALCIGLINFFEQKFFVGGHEKQKKWNNIEKRVLGDIQDYHSQEYTHQIEKKLSEDQIYKKKLDLIFLVLFMRYASFRIAFYVFILPLSIFLGWYTRTAYFIHEPTSTLILAGLGCIIDTYNLRKRLDQERLKQSFYQQYQLERYYFFCNLFWAYLVRFCWFWVFDSYLKRVNVY